jgi:hypothetical protein
VPTYVLGTFYIRYFFTRGYERRKIVNPDVERDLPIPTIDNKTEPQGCAKDAMAGNANLEPFDVAAVDALMIKHTNNNKTNAINDINDGILLIETIPANNNHDPLILPDTSDSDTLDNRDQCKVKDNVDDDLSNDDSDSQNAEVSEEGLTDDQDQGVRRSKRNNKRMPAKYADYGLMMNAGLAEGGQSQATICNSLMFFLAEDLSNAKPIPEDDRLDWVLGVALFHYSIKAGIKKFQDGGEAGVSKELTQMHDMEVFHPVTRDFLTKEARMKAIASLIFLKEKRYHSVKARMCADGQKQRGDWTKQDTTSPTVLTEAVFITVVVNSYEKRGVACFNIPGAFLHADSDKDITMILKGRLAELMVQVKPNLYRKYISISVDRKEMAILYIKMQKAIYRLLRSALLFYMKLVANLESIGFKCWKKRYQPAPPLGAVP